MANDRVFGKYNVCCVDCEAVYQPLVGSPRWWEAKQKAESGKLDALYIDGETHGCKSVAILPNAPYRVFGYDSMCSEYDMPLGTFVEAAKAFLDAQRHGDVVFIQGVSPRVEERLKQML